MTPRLLHVWMPGAQCAVVRSVSFRAQARHGGQHDEAEVRGGSQQLRVQGPPRCTAPVLRPSGCGVLYSCEVSVPWEVSGWALTPLFPHHSRLST